MTKLSVAELVAKARAANEARKAALATNITHTEVQNVFTGANSSFLPTISGFIYNKEQNTAIELAMRAKSFCLIGAAGTGKTTVTREIIGQLTRLPHVIPLQGSTKYLVKGEPGIAVVSFTNKAINNIKKFLPEDLRRHCLTIHKLIEFAPIDALVRQQGMGMFAPKYHGGNKLPHISVLIVEESSMVEKDPLFRQLMSALPNPEQTQFIFLGDLNQLPPIFGYSILGFKLLELETVELTEVYRQALESPIITLAHDIRLGRGLPLRLKEDSGLQVSDNGVHGKVTLHPWKKRISAASALSTMAAMISKFIDAKLYNPETDVILCPFNKSFGTIELNKGIAQKLGAARGETVYEIIAGRNKLYLAVGDRILVDRMDAKILSISPTVGYTGKFAQSESKLLDRWGNLRGIDGKLTSKPVDLQAGMDILDSLVDDEEKKNQASHTVKVEILDTGLTKSLSAIGELNGIVFSYALTVHKSQGSEWPRVFILLHWSHNSMITRELLYTAITRARQELYIILEPQREGGRDSLTKAAQCPEIKGTTLAEKAEFFKGKASSQKNLLEGME